MLRLYRANVCLSVEAEIAEQEEAVEGTLLVSIRAVYSKTK